MKSEYMPLKVGKRGLDDKVKIELPGRLIQPDTRSEISIFIIPGFTGHYEDYIDYFAKKLGQEFNVYVSELRNKGTRSVKHSLDDLVQIDEQVRDRVETNKVIYAPHSMGVSVAAAAIEEHKPEVKGVYAISAYPSVGDVLTRDPDPDKRSLLQIGVDEVLSRLPLDFLSTVPMPLYAFGIKDVFGFPTEDIRTIPASMIRHTLKEANIDQPIRFAIAGKDNWVNTRYPEAIERYETIFSNQFKGFTSRLFEDRNHCFNFDPEKLAPFNEDCPEPLANDIREFVYQNT